MKTLIFLAMSALVSSCATIDGEGDTTKPEVTKPEAPSTLTMRVGESKLISLPSNPTTGYCWSVAKAPAYCTAEIKEYATSESAKLGESDVRIGAASVANITITGKKAGEEVIELRYSRPWEKTPAAPEDTHSIAVKVTE